MKPRLQPAIANLVLIIAFAASSMLCAQTVATPQPEPHGKETLLVTPVRGGGRVELRTALTRQGDAESLATIEAVKTTKTNALADQIERVIILRAFERVVNEIYQTEFDFSVQPAPEEESGDQRSQRLGRFNAKLSSLKEYRDRLRGEIQEATDRTASSK